MMPASDSESEGMSMVSPLPYFDLKAKNKDAFKKLSVSFGEEGNMREIERLNEKSAKFNEKMK